MTPAGMPADRYRIGDFELTLSRNLLEGADVRHTLEPLAAELLAYLARHAGKIVSLQELHEDLWSGRVVTDSSIYRQIAEIRRVLGDDARTPRYVETVRKRGYRLVAEVSTPGPEPVRSAAVPKPGAESQPPHAATTSKKESARGRYRLVTAVALGAAVVATATAFLLGDNDPQTKVGDARRTTIAVLPFEARAPLAPSYLAGGLSQSLSDRLAAIPELRVIAHASVRDVMDRDPGLSTIGRELGADLLVTGTILSAGNSSPSGLKVTAALVDPESGEQLKTREVTGEAEDLFELHDRFANEILRYVGADLRPGYPGDSAGGDPELERRLIEARRSLESGFQLANLEAAIAAYSRILERWPDELEAISARAAAHLRVYANYHDRSTDRLMMARADVDRARELDPGAAPSLFAYGYFLSLAGDPFLAREPLRRAVRQRPSSAFYIVSYARNAARIGDVDEALRGLREAALLDPRNALYRYELGITEFFASEFRNAELSFESALSLSPGLVEARIYLSLLYVNWLGALDAASDEMRKLVALVGRDEFMRLMLTPGLWGFFGFLDSDFTELLAGWSVEENGGDQGSWHLAMATVALRDDNTAEAERQFRAAVEERRESVSKNPSDPWYAAELAIAYAGIGDADAAIDSVNRAVAMAPVEDDPWSNADFLWMRATVFAMLGYEQETLSQVRSAVRFPGILTPNGVRTDPLWRKMLDSPAFVALQVDDGTAWLDSGP